MPLIFINKETQNTTLTTNTTFQSSVSSGHIDTVIEDPDPNQDRIWFRGRAHTLSTLDPLFGLEQHYSPTEGTITYPQYLSTTGWSANGSSWGGFSFLKGSIISSRDAGTVYTNTNNVDNGYFDTFHWTLDFNTYPVQRIWKTTNNKYIVSSPISSGNSANNAHAHNYYLYDNFQNPYYFVNGAVALTTLSAPQVFVYEDFANNKLWGMNRSNQYATGIAYAENYETSALNYRRSRISFAVGTVFFIGADSLGNIYFLEVAHAVVGDPYTVSRYNPTTGIPTVTNVLSGSTNGNNTVSNNRSFPSNLRNDSSTRRVFYSSHFDNSGNLVPVRYVWNPTVADSFVATNCTVTYPSTNTYSTYATKYSLETASTTVPQNPWHCKGQQFTVSGTNYITFWLTDKLGSNPSNGGPSRWNTAPKRTMMTYSIGSGTGDNVLTYHSSYSFPDVNTIPRDFLPINTAGTIVAAPSDNKVSFYNFDPTNGWQLAGTYLTGMMAMGLDRYNRLWGISNEQGASTCHLITPTLPIRITVTLAASTYSYAGANISTTCTVNAYNFLGARIAADVSLTIDGSTMRFTSNNGTSLTVTTLTTGDTSVPLTITGGGINNIIASAVL
jgi:hypothetical protein